MNYSVEHQVRRVTSSHMTRSPPPLRLFKSTLWYLLWLPTRITCHDLGDLCTESAELVLQGGGTVQRRHPRLPQPLHSFAFTAEVGHRGVPVEHQERRGPPLVFQGTAITPEKKRIGWSVLLINNLYHDQTSKVWVQLLKYAARHVMPLFLLINCHTLTVVYYRCSTGINSTSVYNVHFLQPPTAAKICIELNQRLSDTVSTKTGHYNLVLHFFRLHLTRWKPRQSGIMSVFSGFTRYLPHSGICLFLICNNPGYVCQSRNHRAVHRPKRRQAG